MDNEAELERVEGFVAQGNFHAAFNIALSALNACHRESDQAGVDRWLGVLGDILATLSSRFGSGG